MKYIWAIIIVLLSSLACVILVSGISAEIEYVQSGRTLVPDITAMVIIITTGLCGLFSIRNSKSLLLPAIVFPLAGLVQLGFIYGGMTGPNSEQVSLWHSLFLIVLLGILPIAIGYGCFARMKVSE